MSTKVFNRAQQMGYEMVKIAGLIHYVELYSLNNSATRLIWKAAGLTPPVDGTAGFAKGCMYVDLDGGVNTTFYINDGSATSCDFNISAAGDITSVTAGNGLTGGGATGAVTLKNGIAVYNETGGTLTAGTLVNIGGFDGTNGATMVKADADTNLPATHVLDADILTLASGTAYPFATVTGVNTGAQAIGDKVYLSGTAGGFTFTPPTGPDQLQQQVGVVKVVNASGSIVFFPGSAYYKKFGVSFIQAASLTNTEISASAAIAFAKLAALTSAHILVGSVGNVATDVALSGDASLANTGAITVASAAAAFNVGTNITWTKEVAHTNAVATSTTADTAGAALTTVAGAGFGIGAGGAHTIKAGASGAGATGNGGAANLTGGASLATNGNGGDSVLTGGVGNGTGFAGNSVSRSPIFFRKQGAATAKTTSATLTAAEVKAGIITINQGAAGVSAQQLPTVTDLETALPSVITGDSFDISVINISVVDAEDASITTNTGWTLVGNMDFHAYSAAGSLNSSGILRLAKTGAGAWTAFRIG